MNKEQAIDLQLASNISINEKIDVLNKYCLEAIDLHNSPEFKNRTLQCKELIGQVDYPKGLAYNKLAYAFMLWGQFKLEEMQVESKQSIELLKSLNEKKGLMYAYVVDVFGKLALGDFEKSFQYSIKTLKLAEGMADNSATGWANYTMAIVYFDIKDYQNSLKYYSKAVDIFKDLNHEFGLHRSKIGLGSCQLELNQFEEAENTIKEVAYFFEYKYYNAEAFSRAINDLGVLYFKTGKLALAQEKMLQSCKLREGFENKRALNTSLLNYSELLIKLGNFDKAIELLHQSLEIALKYKAKPREMKAYLLLYQSYSNLNDINNAFKYLEKYTKLREEVSSAETNHRLKLQESNFATEKSMQIAEIERQKNIELKAANDKIEEAHKEIKDSINYAKRIQKAILPSQNMLKNLLPEHFILYKPKDVVAGDFYWVNHSESKVLFAAADCTGHGVPGAMVSVVCNNALNRAVKEFNYSKPCAILDKTREIVLEELSKSEEDLPDDKAGVKDGMDITLCSLRNENGKQLLEYAGAYNPLWLIRKGAKEVEVIKADKQPIGECLEPTPFNLHEIDLKKGDMIYLFSDGYQDQFGGINDKKFGSKRLKEVLLNIQNESLESQKKLLDSTLQNWMNESNAEQLDDICIFGVKV